MHTTIGLPQHEAPLLSRAVLGWAVLSEPGKDLETLRVSQSFSELV